MCLTPAARRRRIVRAQISSGVAPSANSCINASAGTGRNCFSVSSVFGVRAAVIEDAENARHQHLPPRQLLLKPIDLPQVVMRDDLRQEKLAGEARVVEEARLGRRIGVGIRPAAQREVRHLLANRFAKLPGVRHASRRTDRPIAAEDDE